MSKDICNDNNVKYISMKDIISLNELTDGLHPNSDGHKKMAEYIYSNIFNI